MTGPARAQGPYHGLDDLLDLAAGRKLARAIEGEVEGAVLVDDGARPGGSLVVLQPAAGALDPVEGALGAGTVPVHKGPHRVQHARLDRRPVPMDGDGTLRRRG